MALGILTLHLHLPGCTSLKDKRRRIKPLMARLHREFNISVAEMAHHDTWQSTTLACALISNDNGHTHRSLQAISRWVEKNWPDISLTDDSIEII